MRPNHEGDTICGEVDVILYNNNNPAAEEGEDADDGMLCDEVEIVIILVLPAVIRFSCCPSFSASK